MKKQLFIGLAVVLIAGCGINNNQSQENQNQNLVNVKNSTIQEVDRTTGQQISQRLVNLATSIPNVNDATAVVLGRYAIVGIDVNKNLERSEVGAIKYSVAESLKNDPDGARAIIIADPDITARLREISEDIQVGKPIQGIMNELADITGRLMPEIPADIIDPNPKDGPEDQKKNLNNPEKQKLEKQQEEQSNHYKDKHD
ncbi:YhcN/YlaJ family sporulation lipoprotein [Bacillus sp. DTU_2020_1000418_1_SI_GHA_SEK_038]|uniref:YhcN/YlaJ family sporulation lipoprotein n=1 Tax=Bacillus sp. DTU_2020_1000418_1_SI_GHA_SEK_038 TaxID=3077585 RepID=UPI0028EDC898|nr:YhcN/YlaJ family sporulation lipoprotein [Bacillus sp. DTU_2020_1000418_1_SI_GHA_SEK_038]WNS77032.1 YhcN/YlaJ family sporulation lipoprotein [Bacillus sp. DTU_2020_1000418_1_SI_GHA_SEK_038]